MTSMKLFLSFTVALLMGSVLIGGAHAQSRFTVSSDGQEVTDTKSGLIWRRCAEGMTFKQRTCTGPALFLNHPEAVARAKSQAGATSSWRLPTMKELSGVVSVRDADTNAAAIDPVAFPGTPLARFWSASTVGSGYFMYVGFVEGSAGEGAKLSPGAVRLVRDNK